MATESTALAHSQLEGYRTAFPAGTLLDIYTGAKPASANDAPTGTKLVTIVLPADPLAAAANRQIAKSGAWTGNAAAAGVAGWGRLHDAADDDTAANTTYERLDFTVSVAGGGGEMILDNTNIAVGQTVTVTAATLSR